MRCVSLFSGCGGLDLGLTQAGFNAVLAAERDRTFAETFARNFPKTPLFVGPVENLTASSMAEISGGETLKEIDLLSGGPPCPPYSKSRFYRKEKPRALDDRLGSDTLNGYIIDMCRSNRHYGHKKAGSSEAAIKDRRSAGRLRAFLVIRHNAAMSSSTLSGRPLASVALK
jgi:hypothetical protein